MTDWPIFGWLDDYLSSMLAWLDALPGWADALFAPLIWFARFVLVGIHAVVVAVEQQLKQANDTFTKGIGDLLPDLPPGFTAACGKLQGYLSEYSWFTNVIPSNAIVWILGELLLIVLVLVGMRLVRWAVSLVRGAGV